MSARLGAWVLLSACNPGDQGVRPDVPVVDGTLAPCVPVAPVVINELCPANRASALDANGESVDWIELVNTGAEPVELLGWSLTDDNDEPQKWQFPTTTLAPNEHALVYASGEGRSRLVASWDTRIERGDPWRYHEPDGPLAGWNTAGFDDASWARGPSGFGREDADDATAVAGHTVYLRTTFTLTDAEAADLLALLLHVDYDDGFVAWLDGREVARANIGYPGLTPDWNDLALAIVEPTQVTGRLPELFDLSDSVVGLGAGPHVLAIEVHNSSETSSDLSIVPILTLGFASPPAEPTSPAIDLELHTNFALGSDGEKVWLYDPAGCAADEVAPVALRADETYGRRPDGSGPLGYFLEATPGAANTTEWRSAFAPTPVFDPPGGYVASGTVAQAVATGAVVHLAEGGKEPTDSDPVHVDPLPIEPGEATVLRARAYADGSWPSRIATATYWGRAPGNLPVISVVTDPVHLFDDDTGIYVLGGSSEPAFPFLGANYWEDWERPAHVTLWEPDGTSGFAVDAGIEIHGHNTRAFEQKALLVTFDGGWGASSVAYEVFPGLGVTSFDRLLLRAGGNDWHGCYVVECHPGAHLRDGMMHTLAAGQNVDALAYRPAELYLNGEFWGLYELRERADAEYIAAHHGEDDVDLLEHSGYPIEGDAGHWLDTLDLLRTSDLADPAVYAEVERRIDVDELATWLALETFYDNSDWPGNNTRWWRPRREGARWRWMLYDMDFGLGNYGEEADRDSLAAALAADGPIWPNPPWSTELFRRMVTSPEFEVLFVNTYADLLNTALVPDVTRASLHEHEAALAPVMPRQVARWGEWTDGTVTHTLPDDAWETEIDRIEQWLDERPDYARAHLVSSFGLDGTFTLTIDADPPGGGTLGLTTAEVGMPFTGTYFSGVPLTITAIPAAGKEFAGWSDPTLPQVATITVNSAPDEGVDLTATFR